MLSSDENIETIGQLVEQLRHYVELRGQYLRLDAVDKLVRLLSVAVVSILAAALIGGVMVFLSFAAASALTAFVGQTWAYIIVGAAYLVVLLFVVALRHRLIERPLVRFLASILLPEQQ